MTGSLQSLGFRWSFQCAEADQAAPLLVPQCERQAPHALPERDAIYLLELRVALEAFVEAVVVTLST